MKVNGLCYVEHAFWIGSCFEIICDEYDTYDSVCRLLEVRLPPRIFSTFDEFLYAFWYQRCGDAQSYNIMCHKSPAHQQLR